MLNWRSPTRWAATLCLPPTSGQLSTASYVHRAIQLDGPVSPLPPGYMDRLPSYLWTHWLHPNIPAALGRMGNIGGAASGPAAAYLIQQGTPASPAHANLMRSELLSWLSTQEGIDAYETLQIAWTVSDPQHQVIQNIHFTRQECDFHIAPVSHSWIAAWGTMRGFNTFVLTKMHHLSERPQDMDVDLSCRLLTHGGEFKEALTSVVFLYQAVYFADSDEEPRTGYWEALFSLTSHSMLLQPRSAAGGKEESDIINKALLEALKETGRRWQWKFKETSPKQTKGTKRAARGGGEGRGTQKKK